MYKHKDWVDSWKGGLILLVVLGHVIGPARVISCETARPIFLCAYDLIYSFHMPAFFLLLGYMWHESRDFKSFLLKKSFRMLVPYFVVGLLSIIVYLMFAQGVQESATVMATTSMGKSFYANKKIASWWMTLVSLMQAGEWPKREGLRYNSVLWFLPCMFSTQIIFFWLGRVRRCFLREKLYWGVVFMVSMALATVVSRYHITCWPWGVNRVPGFMLFVLVGFWLARSRVLDRLQTVNPLLGIVLSSLGFVMWVWFWRGVRTDWQTLNYVWAYLGSLLGIGCSVLMTASFRGGGGCEDCGNVGCLIHGHHAGP